MSNNEIIYPFLLPCCQFASNTFWKNVFEELAYAKPPYGTYISKDFFCCNYKGKEFSYKIEKKDPSILYKEIYNLLLNKLGLNSNQEKFKKKNKIIAFENSIIESRQQWNNIRKKNVKDIYIERYVISMKKKHNLDETKTKYLYSILYIGMSFKIINSKDIEFENNEITNIKGVEFKNNTIVCSKLFKSDTINISNDVSVEQKTMLELWKKYLKDLKKNEI
jgi:hypothetical protein